MASEGILTHQQMVRGLVKLCKEKASGTVFFNLDDGRSARLVLNRGAICWAAFQHLRGEAAIDAISEIEAARLCFNPVLKLAIGEQHLGSTLELVKRLNGEVHLVAEEHVPVVSDVVASQPATIDTGGDKPFNLDQVRDVLERESMEYLGPMAIPLCGEYLNSLPFKLNLAQVRQVISALIRDINDEQKALRFSERVRSALGIHPS